MMKKRVSFWFLTLICGILAVFSGGCITAGQPELFNVEWKPAGSVPERAFLIFTPDRKRVVGCAADNRFFGPVQFQEPDRLSVGMLGSTRMASPNYRFEQKFLENLQAAKRYRFESRDELVLLDIDGEPCLRLHRKTAGEIR